MGEEKKESKDIKKLKYEQPKLIKLSGAAGTGQCINGSGDIACYSGNSAAAGCVDGNAANSCLNGSGV